MQTTYVRFCHQHNDPVWGPQPLPWIKTPLVRVTRNSLRKAHFEWVGNPSRQFSLDDVRKSYPVAMPVYDDPSHGIDAMYNVGGNRPPRTDDGQE